MNDVRRQALQVALYATWLTGLLCIVVSLYATQLLPGLVEQKVDPKDVISLTLTLFTVPDPFKGSVGAAQARAIYSWLNLSPHLQVVLLGKDSSLVAFAEETNGRVMVDSDIDFTFSGAPLFNSVLSRACSSASDVSVLVDSQFILMKDFMETIEYAHSLQHSWLLVATAKSVHMFPFVLDPLNGLWFSEGLPARELEVHAYAKSRGLWKPCMSRYIWAWSTENVPLHVGVMPSFVYGYGFHHEWLLNEAISSGIRFVFDASHAISAFYVGKSERNGLDEDDGGAIVSREGVWEANNNAHLAALYGSYYFRPSDFVNTPARLSRCGEPSLKVFQFLYPLVGSRSSLEEKEVPVSLSGHNLTEMEDVSSQWQPSDRSFSTSFRRYARHRMSVRYLCPPAAEVRVRDHKRTSSLKKRLMIDKLRVSCDCDNITDEMLDCPSSRMRRLPKVLSFRSSMAETSHSMPLSLELLLAKVSSVDKTIVLSVVGNNYKDMLMNWVCRLRKLQISSFVIGAIDTQLYEFGLLQGLPVFMSGPGLDVIFNDCHFGTECFKRVTKMKSRVVLQVLKLGYKVLFSDVDVYWFKNPIEYLKSFGAGTIAAQSDQWNVTEAPNKPRRLNSGFYFAWPDASTITAFERIVEHASASNMSEQPSFYDVLCGEGGRHRLGNNRCLEPETNVATIFLDRDLFPNGGYKDLWEKKNVSEACSLQACFVLHNNWVSGRQRKFVRQIASGLWDYDAKTRLCTRRWQSHGQTGP